MKLTKQQEKVYKKLYNACGKLNEIAYQDWIEREKQGEKIETQPFKPHELTIPIVELMGKIISGESDPSEGLKMLRKKEIKQLLDAQKLLTAGK